MMKQKREENSRGDFDIAENLHKKIVSDFVFISVCAVISVIFIYWSDGEAVEWLYSATRPYEDWDLDELLLVLPTLGLFSALFFARRFSDLRKLNQQLSELAYTDTITSLPNRCYALKTLQSCLSNITESGGMFAVVFLDFDNFKQVNDKFGHAAGDELIRLVGLNIKGVMREGDILARMGGDEFLILIKNAESIMDVEKVTIRLTDVQESQYLLEGTEVKVTFSIGVAIAPTHSTNSDTIIKYADKAMYRSKELGKSQVVFYSEELALISDNPQARSGMVD